MTDQSELQITVPQNMAFNEYNMQTGPPSNIQGDDPTSYNPNSSTTLQGTHEHKYVTFEQPAPISLQILSKPDSAIAQDNTYESPFMMQGRGARMMMQRGIGPLMDQSQVSFIRKESQGEMKWNLFSSNNLALYDATYSMLPYFIANTL